MEIEQKQRIEYLVIKYKSNSKSKRDIEEELLNIYKDMFKRISNSYCNKYSIIDEDEVLSGQYLRLLDCLRTYKEGYNNFTHYLATSLRNHMKTFILEFYRKQNTQYRKNLVITSLDNPIIIDGQELSPYDVTPNNKVLTPLDILIKRERLKKIELFKTYLKEFLNFSDQEIDIFISNHLEEHTRGELALKIGKSEKHIDNRLTKMMICVRSNLKLRKNKPKK